ncbi:hypothetical protein CLOSTMETH_03346 [[Clostridium] methylpentosum DSM 5476]|uniref:Uncharacterized protein n=1 Tax=[Clostridium] methylpentosum DSM 5476 TaxID=537013 RepID=C0EHK1_9FIRM|nr:hypothetical protein CLOSTMETH_03346 [[Clostridium] methylpentosum DSM 5476]
MPLVVTGGHDFTLSLDQTPSSIGVEENFSKERERLQSKIKIRIDISFHGKRMCITKPLYV